MRVKTDAKRQAILDAAGEVFSEQGFAGASMTAVAQRVGGSKATVYRYFPSKEALFLAAMMGRTVEPFIDLFEALAAGRDLRRTLERFGTHYLSLALSAEVLSLRRVLMAEAERSGAGQRLFDQGPKVTWQAMADFLEGEMDARRLRHADPWTTAMHLRGMLEADLLGRALYGAEVDARPANLRRHATDAVDALLRAYGPDSP